MLKALYEKYKTVILYVFFGGLTTLVNIVSYVALSRMLSFKTTVLENMGAWFISVVFAFVTNKYFVFHGGASKKKAILIELAGFFAARVFSGVTDVIIVFSLVDLLSFPQIPVKLASNVLVVVLNYVASKEFIFKNK